MRAHILYLLPLALLLGCKTSHDIPARDEALTTNIVGTWVNAAANHQPFNSESTYRADGTGLELVWPKGGDKDKAVKAQTHWMIKDGLLVVHNLRSTNPEQVAEGRTFKDKILAMSKDQFTYEPWEGYGPSSSRQLIKLRK